MPKKGYKQTKEHKQKLTKNHTEEQLIEFLE